MVSPAMLIVALVIAIAIILFCIIVLKLNASIGMVLASLFMGVAGGLKNERTGPGGAKQWEKEKRGAGGAIGSFGTDTPRRAVKFNGCDFAFG